ncbi:MAG TPA: hypothetical protein VF791_22045 [Pyrinomonadaceae bacterium]
MNTEPREDFYSVPIRRTRWSSIWIALAAFFASSLLAAAFCGLLIWSSIKVGGAVIIIVFGLLCGAMFFFSRPWQRRYARSFDSRRPGIRFAGGVLAVPVTDDLMLQFNLAEPHEWRYGWFEAVVATNAAPTTHTRAVLTYATLAQAGQQLLLKAEESVREAQMAGWPKSAEVPQTTPVVRLWATDLVALVEALRSLTELRSKEA